MPLKRHDNHVYAEMSSLNRTLYTRTQLHKLHRQFGHPSANKLYQLLKRANPAESFPDVLRELEEISKQCDPCQRIQHAPKRFRVSFGAEDVRFNERLFIDIMYLDGKPVLHIIDD
eukprot:IDg237t1